MIELAQRVKLPADAYELPDDEKYAKQAVELIYTWFIDEKTAMYPHLEHAQIVRGLNRGRSYGVMKLALHGKELGVDFRNAEDWFSGNLEDAWLYMVNRMDEIDPTALVYPEDPTDTGGLYNKLIENAQVLFGTEIRLSIQNDFSCYYT